MVGRDGGLVDQLQRTRDSVETLAPAPPAEPPLPPEQNALGIPLESVMPEDEEQV